MKETLTALNAFKNRLALLGPLHPETWEAFSSKLEYVQFKKGGVLTTADAVEQYIYFIIKGAVRVYVVSDGKDVITNFRFDNQFTSSLTSFLQQAPSQYYVDTLVESKMLRFSYTSLQYLYKHHLELNVLGRILMEQLLIDKRQRELDFLTLSADKRYKKLTDEHPEYIHNIPLKYIASYLGVTPESLSRIRSNLAS